MRIATHRLLTAEEIKHVLAHQRQRIATHQRRGNHFSYWHARCRLIAFRLSACCGMRAKEICGVDFMDVNAHGDRPVIVIRKAITKGVVKDVFREDGTRYVKDTRRARFIPLSWSRGTADDFMIWKTHLSGKYGVNVKCQPFIPRRVENGVGVRHTVRTMEYVWRRLLNDALGKERSSQIRLHDGRHSYASHALHIGHSLAAVRDALGHANIATTSGYLHSMDNDDVPDLF